MKILLLDCSCGLNLNMLLEALLQLGIEESFIYDQIKNIDLDNHKLEFFISKNSSFTTKEVRISIPVQSHNKDHNFQTIISRLENSTLTPFIKKIVSETYLTLMRSQRQFSALPTPKIMVDYSVASLIYLIAIAACLEKLAPEKIFLSSLALGSGLVPYQDGWLPIPNPVTADLVKGLPVKMGPVQGELVGTLEAALLNVLIGEYSTPPVFIPQAYGYGFCQQNLQSPYFIRVILGETEIYESFTDDVATLETNIDDMNPEFYPYLVEKFLSKGALDVFLTPIIMKKGRPAIKLSILCKPSCVQKFSDLILRESSSLGVRISYQSRRIASREVIKVQTCYGIIKIKVARINPGSPILRLTPEYEDCKNAAFSYNVPIDQIYQESLKAAQSLKLQ